MIAAEYLKGIWKNQHGSVLTISETTKDGTLLKGSFKSSVGNATKEESVLGQFIASEDTEEALITFSVCWRHTISSTFPSVCAWNGQLRKTESQSSSPHLELHLTWILNRSHTSNDNWDGYIINQDVFHKISNKS